MRRTLALLFLLVSALMPARVGAHPHVWVDAIVDLHVTEGQLTAVTLNWEFDPFFSLILFEEFDVDGDRAFGPDEISAIREAAFNGLGEVGFFTDLRTNGAIERWDTPETFEVFVDEEELVTYRFTLTVAEPADVVDDEITVALYDPEFYVYVGFNQEQPIRTIGGDGLDCGFKTEKAFDIPLYFNTYFPIRATLVCENPSG